MIIIWVIAALAAILPLILYACYLIAFRRLGNPPETFKGASFAPHTGEFKAGKDYYNGLTFEEISIRSHDGLTLHARYAPAGNEKKIMLLFHGYRSSAKRDFCCVLKYYREKGFSLLLVDQRAHGESEGKVISFGINERYDCRAWAEYVAKRCGNDAKLFLDGVSMGAATVMMASTLKLPESVRGIIADCGYTSPAAIIQKVIKQRHLPVHPFYFFIRLGARLFGRFDLEETSPEEAMRECKLPVLFAHGEADNFVPCEMTRKNYAACTAPKRLITVLGADHGLSYLMDRPGVERELEAFLEGLS